MMWTRARTTFNAAIAACGFYSEADLIEYFSERRAQDEVDERFAPLLEHRAAIARDLGSNLRDAAATPHGLIRFMLKRKDIPLESKCYRRDGERLMFYHIDPAALELYRETISNVIEIPHAVVDLLVNAPSHYPPSKEIVKREIRSRRRRIKRQLSRDGYIYLLSAIHDPALFKIGRTNDPDNRLKTFNVKLPFPVEYDCLISTDDMYALESELHAQFADKRLEGEWFRLNADDVDYIRQLARKDEQP